MFVVVVPNLNLNQIFMSRQSLRWMKVSDRKFILKHEDKILMVEQTGENICLHCTDEEFYSTWYHYFDMHVDYTEINYMVEMVSAGFKQLAYNLSGIRVLNQNLFEVILTSIARRHLPYDQAYCLLDKIAKTFGKERKDHVYNIGKVVWHELPTPTEIYLRQAELYLWGDDADVFEYMVQVCESIHEGWLSLDELEQADRKTAKELLAGYDGIDPAVISDILIHGLHMLDVFPVGALKNSELGRKFLTALEIPFLKDWTYNGILGDKIHLKLRPYMAIVYESLVCQHENEMEGNTQWVSLEELESRLKQTARQSKTTNQRS